MNVCLNQDLPSTGRRRQRAAVRKLEHFGVSIGYIHEWDKEAARFSGTAPPGPLAIRALMGKHYFSVVDSVIVDDYNGDVDLLAPLAALISTTQMGITDCSDGDRILQYALSMAGLKYLSLCGTDVTDTGIRLLFSARCLRDLVLTETRVINDGIKALRLELPECTIHRENR